MRVDDLGRWVVLVRVRGVHFLSYFGGVHIAQFSKEVRRVRRRKKERAIFYEKRRFRRMGEFGSSIDRAVRRGVAQSGQRICTSRWKW
ncbi:hypothetical protein COLO4_02997 [Corchorus olitorius]|uniref:Uncharacterized protein n=1 Tax=Corchorus olitorius TaxID=93759 RepID=A0A1R3KZS0_9ROSI|nr:hypothetical protein COLO4_02997 [Corchorus olitorius]